MKRFDYTIRDEVGIHARPAGMIVKLVKDSGCNVTIEKDGQIAEGGKLFSIMRLGVKCGDKINISVEGENEEAVAAEILKYFEENL